MVLPMNHKILTWWWYRGGGYRCRSPARSCSPWGSWLQGTVGFRTERASGCGIWRSVAILIKTLLFWFNKSYYFSGPMSFAFQPLTKSDCWINSDWIRTQPKWLLYQFDTATVHKCFWSFWFVWLSSLSDVSFIFSNCLKFFFRKKNNCFHDLISLLCVLWFA